MMKDKSATAPPALRRGGNRNIFHNNLTKDQKVVGKK